MTDFHMHLLPGIDDGSDSVETSLRMLARSAGVGTVCATPHFYADRDTPERFLRRRAEAWELLRSSLPEGAPRILLGAEVHYFEGISRTEQLPALCLEGTKLLLLEMPFGPWPERILREAEAILDRGLIPVAAHLERYAGFNDVTRLTERGVLAQCNAEFFLTGRTARRALRLLRERRIQFLGSDAHNLGDRAPNLAQAMEKIEGKLGADALAWLRETEESCGLHRQSRQR